MVRFSLFWKESDMRTFLSRSLVMYCSMVSAYDNVHIRSNLPRLEEATKYAKSAGDRFVVRRPKFLYLGQSKLYRVYASLATFYSVQTRLFIGQPRTLCSLFMIAGSLSKSSRRACWSGRRSARVSVSSFVTLIDLQTPRPAMTYNNGPKENLPSVLKVALDSHSLNRLTNVNDIRLAKLHSRIGRVHAQHLG